MISSSKAHQRYMLWSSVILVKLLSSSVKCVAEQSNQTIKAPCIPLADHYAALVAFDENRKSRSQATCY